MDIESLRIAEETARWAFWSMVAAAISALATVVTAIIAYNASETWRKQEKLNQLVRLKRAVFRYRTYVESVGSLQNDPDGFDEYITNTMRPALGDIFHELVLAGLNGNECKQKKLFEEVFQNQRLFEVRDIKWATLLKSTVDLQESIEIKI